MGYKIRNVFGISPNDTHAFFLYYVPGYEFQRDWINEYIDKQFDKIASQIGPEGVIIAPTIEHDDTYLASILDTTTGGCFFGANYKKFTGNPDYWDIHKYRENKFGEAPPWYNLKARREWKLKVENDEESNSLRDGYEEFSAQEHELHYGKPYLIFSSFPLGNDKSRGVIIDLSDLQNERELGLILDIIIAIISGEEIEKIKLFVPTEEKSIDNLSWFDALELKPNIAGLGINFNFLLKIISEKLIEKGAK